MKNTTVSYVILRLAVAMSMLSHGLVRLPKLEIFSKWMTDKFEVSMLPKAFVLPFSYVLPFAEFIVGFLLLIGLFTRYAAIAGGVIMVLLIFGSGMLEDWGAIPSQLIHAAFFAYLINNIDLNGFSANRQ